MKLTRSSLYAIYALSHLARQAPEARTTAEEIGDARGISKMYVRKVLERLIVVGIVRTKKGPGGGYRLAKPAKDISLLEVIEAVDGALHGEVPEVNGSRTAVELTKHLAKIYGQTGERTRKTLAGVTLAGLMEKK